MSSWILKRLEKTQPTKPGGWKCCKEKWEQSFQVDLIFSTSSPLFPLWVLPAWLHLYQVCHLPVSKTSPLPKSMDIPDLSVACGTNGHIFLHWNTFLASMALHVPGFLLSFWPFLLASPLMNILKRLKVPQDSISSPNFFLYPFSE